MDRIEVTPEMRRRVLKRIREAEPAPARPKAPRFPALNKYLPAAACLALLIAGAAVLLPRAFHSEEPDPPVLLQPPVMEEAASLRELSGLVGFEVTEDFVLPFPAEQVEYLAYGSGLAQATYTGAGQTAEYRQSVGSQDNSGDYTSYEDVVQTAVGGRSVTLKGTDGAYVLALWTDGEFSRSLRLTGGISESEWLAVLGR